MKKYRKPIQYIVFALVLLIGGYAVGNALFASKTTVLRVGDKPPEFKLLDLDGQTHELSEYRGKPLIVNFWGSFCPPCRNEMPAFQNIYDKWKDQGVQLVGINLSETRVSVDTFISMVGTHFPILLDQNRITEKQYGLKQYPTTFFIDANGVIREVKIGGPLSEADIETGIQKLIGTKS